MASPPPLPAAGRSLRLAGALNIFLPGAGLFCLGRRRTGATLALAFLVCFLAELGIFVVSYGRYLSLALSDDLLKNDNLERIGDVFPRAWLIGFAGMGMVIYLWSIVLFTAAKRKFADPQAS